MRRKCLAGCLGVCAVFCIGYFIFLTCKIGPAFRFNYVWLMLGLFFAGIALVVGFSRKGLAGYPKPWIGIMEAIVICGCLLFVVVEAGIIRYAGKQPDTGADYVIVLGAQVRGSKPSLILQYRIEKAAEYLQANPDALAIVSGGQGPDEKISEAEAMERGLCRLGIDKKRIIQENASVSTKENLDFSAKYLDPEKDKVVIVTTDFHVLRAVRIAKKAGYRHVSGAAARSVWYLIPTNYVREFLAVLKDLCVGNM